MTDPRSRHEGRELDEALDRAPAGGGTVSVARPHGSADVDVVEVDRIGVRVRGVTVNRDQPADVAREAERLPGAIRSLPDRLAPVEVDPTLGGAKLRTRPDELRGREYFEVDVAPTRTSIRRTTVSDDGERAPADWTLTREQLERLIGEAEGT
jgi:hypothetical protein